MPSEMTGPQGHAGHRARDPDSRTSLLGAHVPITGGLHKAPENGRAIAAEAIQIFTRNQVQWKANPIRADESNAFGRALRESGVQMVITHGSYLVNLASPDPRLLARSQDAFVADLERCQALGIPYLIFHPGAHKGQGEESGLATVARSLDTILARAHSVRVMPLLEVSAGQGSCLGYRFEHIKAILNQVRSPERLGVCLDTCHLAAAGYDLTTPARYHETLDHFDNTVGLARVKALHLNDTEKGLGSRVDRHAPIGKGILGQETFRRIVNEPRFAGLPMVVETPGPLSRWKEEVALLRGLRNS